MAMSTKSASVGQIPAGTYYIGAGCGVPYEWAPLILRIYRSETTYLSPGAWLTGYEIGRTGEATAIRTVYVGITAGMELLLPTPRRHPPAHRPARNSRAVVPRPRTPSDTTVTTAGRTR
jgi:hypothetical protein